MSTSPPNGLAIELVGLHRAFDEFVAVKHLDLEIADGEFFSLIGPSGCGKTTTLKMIAGLVSPTSGDVIVHGRDVTQLPPYQRTVNTVFQNYALFPHLSIFDNVAFGLVERREKKAEIRKRVSDMLDLVQLGGRDDDRPRQLSGGQQQRVALARALVLEPEVLLLDEPLGALDLRLRRDMQILIKQVQHEIGITFIYVTHDQEEAFSMSTRVGVMNHGVLEQIGVPRDVYQKPASAFVADFVGASNHLNGTVESVSGSNSYTVRLASEGALVVCDGADGLSVGSQVRVVLRAESIHLGGPVEGGVNLSSNVVDASYSGPHTLYVVKTDEGRLLKVAVDGGADIHPEGSSVSLLWRPRDAWVVSAGDVDDSEERLNLTGATT